MIDHSKGENIIVKLDVVASAVILALARQRQEDYSRFLFREEHWGTSLVYLVSTRSPRVRG